MKVGIPEFCFVLDFKAKFFKALLYTTVQLLPLYDAEK